MTTYTYKSDGYLGTFGKDVAEYIIKTFKEKRNEYKERDPRRIKCHIVQRGRGRRNLWKKVKLNKEKTNIYRKDHVFNEFKFVKITSASGQEDLPIEYAPKVALYLRVANYAQFEEAQKYVKFIDTIKIVSE